jgi:hypothetical protein
MTDLSLNEENDESEENKRRWRLVLGGKDEMHQYSLTRKQDQNIDQALTYVYMPKSQSKGGQAEERSAGLGGSSPKVARWLGDIRTYFPSTVVSVMQKDAIERLNLKKLLFEKEVLATITPDVNLVATLVALGSALPAKSKETARQVVNQVCREVMRRIESPLRAAVRGALNKSQRNFHPRHNEIDWNRTIKANLKHYQKDYQSIIPERLIGYGRKRSSLQEIVLLVDQSGSMATSVVYASIFAAVLASIPALSTKLIVFDTNVVDLSDKLQDPVEVIFGTQLGGGTDINTALGYCQNIITRPADTIMILISDLYEGGNAGEMLKRAFRLKHSCVQLICLLALNDEGAPAYDHKHASALAQMDIPTFASTPDQFPELISLAISKGDISSWQAKK